MLSVIDWQVLIVSDRRVEQPACGSLQRIWTGPQSSEQLPGFAALEPAGGAAEPTAPEPAGNMAPPPGNISAGSKTRPPTGTTHLEWRGRSIDQQSINKSVSQSINQHYPEFSGLWSCPSNSDTLSVQPWCHHGWTDLTGSCDFLPLWEHRLQNPTWSPLCNSQQPAGNPELPETSPATHTICLSSGFYSGSDLGPGPSSDSGPGSDLFSAVAATHLYAGVALAASVSLRSVQLSSLQEGCGGLSALPQCIVGQG